MPHLPSPPPPLTPSSPPSCFPALQTRKNKLVKNKMSLGKRHSSSSPPPSDLKHRVITCLNKLSDRDTFSVASNELESIARGLSQDSFSPFLTCLSTTDSSEKSPVRKQCVRLLGLLSTSHGDSLSPHLTKMLAAVVGRLRDSDSAVRFACVDAVSSMASQITKPPFSSLSKPLVEAILHEQDYNLQIGSALCLAAAIEASPDSEPVQLQKLLPKLLKLVKNDCFKPKPAMLSLIGSIVSAGGAKSRNLLNCLTQCLLQFLNSEDWAVRKAAADALLRLATTEKNNLSEFKSSCLNSLESRRFDKVKVVRDTMNQAFEMWKMITAEEDLSVLRSSIVHPDNGSEIYSSVKKGPCQVAVETHKAKKPSLTRRSPASDSFSTTAMQKNFASKTIPRQPKMGFKITSASEIETVEPQPTYLEVVSEDDLRITNSRLLGSADDGIRRDLKQEVTRVLFNNDCDDESHKVGGLRPMSRLVPFIENETCKLNEVDESSNEETFENLREAENFSLIQEQLVQIENQQSILLALLQRFIGSSQTGMNSLETRVNGLEMALDEISQNLAVSSGSVSDTESSGNTCCMLPPAEFLSPKFWRKTEGQYSGRKQLFSNVSNMPINDSHADIFKPDNSKSHQRNGNRSAVRYIGGTFRDYGCSKPFSNRMPKKIFPGGENVLSGGCIMLDGGSFENRAHYN